MVIIWHINHGGIPPQVGNTYLDMLNERLKGTIQQERIEDIFPGVPDLLERYSSGYSPWISNTHLYIDGARKELHFSVIDGSMCVDCEMRNENGRIVLGSERFMPSGFPSEQSVLRAYERIAKREGLRPVVERFQGGRGNTKVSLQCNYDSIKDTRYCITKLLNAEKQLLEELSTAHIRVW